MPTERFNEAFKRNRERFPEDFAFQLSDRFVALAERLLALNPSDNHFVREPLSRAYLARGQADRAIALTGGFPEDLCGPALNRILALVRLERRGDALVALRDAAKPHRVAIEMLLADAPKQPRTGAAFGITLGGKEEAWEYRVAHRALWERDGALAWLRAAWSEVRRSAGRRLPMHRGWCARPP